MPEHCGRLGGVGPVRTAASELVARYAVVLDACVLVPIALADTLLRLAERDLYRPLWSTRIVAEAIDAIVEIHPQIPPERVRTRFAAMGDAFEDACTEGWETLEHTVTLPDADDRHVVAAALRGRADAIVTANLGDYPTGLLAPLGMRSSTPTTSCSTSSTSPRGSCSTSSENKLPTPASLPWRPSTSSLDSPAAACPASPTKSAA
jgi:predicted nucleic acid-binding protein